MKIKNKRRIILATILIFMTSVLTFLAYSFEYKAVKEYKIEDSIVDIGDFVSEFGHVAFLTGQVRYYDKEFLSLSEIKSNKFDYKLRDIEKNVTFKSDPHSVKGYGTYYLKVKLQGDSKDYGLIMPEIATAYKLFIDGRQVFKMGTIAVNEKEHIGKFKSDTAIFTTESDEFDIVLQVSNFDYRIFAMLNKIAIANSETVKSHNNLVYSKTAALSSAAFILAIFYMSIYIWLRNNKEYLYFALFSLSLAIRTLTYDNKLLYEFFDFKWKTQLDISLVTTMFSIVFLIQYFRNSYKDSEIGKVSNFFIIIYISMIIPISMSTGSALRGSLVNIMVMVEFSTVLYFIYILIRGAKKNVEGSVLTMISMLIILISYYFDIRNGYIQNYITYSLYLLLVMQGVVLGMKFSNSYISLGQAQNDLSIYVETLRAKNIELEESRNKLSEININLDKIVLEKTKTVKALLDNGDLKVMYINQDINVGNEYSDNCFDIFDKDIKDQNYVDLMHDENDGDKSFYFDLIKRIFAEEDKNKKQVYMSLLPSEYKVNNHVLKVLYKIINLEDKEFIMIIMDDVTKERELENKYLEDIREIRAMLSVVLDVSEFKKLANDFIRFWDMEFNQLYKNRQDDKLFLDKIMRVVHSQKGNFSIYQRSTIVQKLHYIEEEMLSYSELDKVDLLVEKLNSHNLSGFIRDDMETIEKLYGYKIELNENYLEVRESSIIEIVDLLEKTSADKSIISKLNSIRDIEFNLIAKKYDDFIMQKSEVAIREFKKLEINGGKTIIAYSKVSHINKILNICIRNSIYHGIESPETRRNLGKKSKGKIKISILDEKDKYILTVSDDGSGIDVDGLKEKILEKNNGKYKSISEISYEDAISSIYEDGLSLAKEVNTLAGRGFGMSALYSEVKALNGHICIETEKGKGTSISVSIIK